MSSVISVSSVCMLVMDIHVYGIDLVSVIFRSAFAHDTQAPPQASWFEGPSRSPLVFVQSKVNSVRYIAQVVNPMILSFLRQEDGVLFNRTTHIHIRLLRRKVQQLPWPARSPNLSLIEHIGLWDMMKKEVTLSPEPLPNCENGYKTRCVGQSIAG